MEDTKTEYSAATHAVLVQTDDRVEDLECLLDRQVVCAHSCLSVQMPAGETTVVHTAPRHTREAHRRPDAPKWIEAEEKELQGLREKRVFTYVRLEDIPPHLKVLTTRFVYDFKTNERNEILKYKARLVVRGFEQRAGLEYGETFSATVRATSVRTVLSLAAKQKLRLHQFDVEQAFLTASMNKDVVYAQPPPGQERPGYAWRLDKALYGLKQASHLFEKHFAEILLTELSMKRMNHDKSIYMMKRKRRGAKDAVLIVCVYVDDLVVAYSDADILAEFKAGLTRRLAIKDVGTLKYCLGMTIEQDERFNVTVCQRGFVEELLSRTGFLKETGGTRVTPVPIDGDKLVRADCPQTPEEEREMQTAPYNQYRSIVGSLMYLTGATRPDIAYAVNMLSRFVANPGKKHWHSLVHLLMYLNGTPGLGLRYTGCKDQGVILEQERRDQFRRSDDDKPNPSLMSESFGNNLVAYVDASHATDVDTRKSTTGWVTCLNGGPISWRTKRQATVATSTAESELYALDDCMKEVRWLQMLLGELGFSQPRKPPGRGGATAEPDSKKNRGTVIFEDNEGCIQISQNDVFHQRTKHVHTQWCFVMEYVHAGHVCVTHAPTSEQVADLMTKGVTNSTLRHLRSRLMGTWCQDGRSAPS